MSPFDWMKDDHYLEILLGAYEQASQSQQWTPAKHPVTYPVTQTEVDAWVAAMEGAFESDGGSPMQLPLGIVPPTTEQKCTCGSASLGSPKHSDWCDIDIKS